MATTPLVSLFDKEIFVKIKRVPGTAGMACRLLLATFCLCDIPRENQTGHEEECIYYEGD